MTVNDLKDGLKVDVRILQKINRNGLWIDDQRHYASSIHHIAYDGSIELTMPMRQGKVVLFPMGLRYELIFVLENNRMVKAIAEIEKRFRKGKRILLRANLITPIEKCQRREYYRLNCKIPVSFVLMENNEIEMKHMDEILKSLKSRTRVFGDGVISNISGGGIRFTTDEPLAAENEYLFIGFSLKNGNSFRNIQFVGKVVGRDKLENGKGYAYRTKIIFKDSHCQEVIIRYIFEQERISRKKEFGV